MEDSRKIVRMAEDKTSEDKSIQMDRSVTTWVRASDTTFWVNLQIIKLNKSVNLPNLGLFY